MPAGPPARSAISRSPASIASLSRRWQLERRGKCRACAASAARIPLFDFLQKLPAGEGGSLLQTCRRYVQTARNAGPLLLCSDLMDPDWQEALRALTSRPFEITILHTLAPQELRPEIDGDFRLLDAEGGAPIEITADLDVLRRYDENLRAWRDEIESFCNGRGITYIFVDTSAPVEDFVLSTLRRRGVLR